VRRRVGEGLMGGEKRKQIHTQQPKKKRKTEKEIL
jgi:hypothetical protein